MDLFSAMVLCGKLPKYLKWSRTTIITKENDEWKLLDISVTGGLIVLQVFSRVLTWRLAEACRTHVCQRGFITLLNWVPDFNMVPMPRQWYTMNISSFGFREVMV